MFEYLVPGHGIVWERLEGVGFVGGGVLLRLSLALSLTLLIKPLVVSGGLALVTWLHLP